MTEKKVNFPKCVAVSAGKSVVIVANELNLSIFKPVWLCQFDILKPEELSEGILISPAAIQIPGPTFQLVILPNRLQMTFPSSDVDATTEPLNRVLGGILRALPHTPLVGLGMNLDFFVAPAAGNTFEEWNAEHFASKVAFGVCGGAETRPRFGSYFSMQVEGMRLKVDAKPVSGVQASPQVVKALEAASEWMHFGFNYHHDLDQNASTKHALELLSKWSAVVSHARSIVSQLPA
ncbi:MAG: hypothetical protein AAB676_16065 [Verrucomicrobiota bacterium]